jgi:hypothetical protein
MINEIALSALDRILATEYNLLEIYEHYCQEAESELLELFENHRGQCQQMTQELAAVMEQYGAKPRQGSGLIGTVFRLGENMGSQLWSPSALIRQIKLAMEEKYRLLSRLPSWGLATVERHLGLERQMLLELEEATEPAQTPRR